MIQRARVTEPFKTYYDGVPMSFETGDVLEGPIADFLYAGGSAVEPLGDQAAQDSADAGGGGESVPDGSAKDILDWVGADASRAQSAIEAEQARDKPRSTLLAELAKIAGS